MTSWDGFSAIRRSAEVRGWTSWLRALGMAAILSCACGAKAQAVPALAQGVTRTEGEDAASGIVWVRFALAAEGLSAKDATVPEVSPALTVQCSRSGLRRSVDLYIDFGGADRSFHAPPVPDPVTHFLPFFAPVTIKLDFPGYRPFKRQFETMPWGEYHYRPPGLGSANMEPVSFFLQYMYAVPVVRVSTIDRKLGDKGAEFHTAGLMDVVRTTEMCK